MKAIETDRLMLRNFIETDESELFNILNERKNEFFEGYPNITKDNVYEHLKYRLGNDEFIAIILKENNLLLGNIYLGKRDFNTLELGYIIRKEYMHQGIASEASNALINEAFLNGVHRIYAECDPRNTASWKLLEKLGFTKEATLKQNIYFHKDELGNPLWQDTYIYAKLKS